MAWVEFLLNYFVIETEIYRKSVLPLGFSELVRIFHKFIEIEPAVLLQLAKNSPFAKYIEQLEDDRPKESDLIDDDIDILKRLGREYFRHNQSLGYKGLILVLPPHLVNPLPRKLYLLSVHFHQILEQLLNLRTPLVLLYYLFAHQHDRFLSRTLWSLREGCLLDSARCILARLLEDRLVYLFVVYLLFANVQQQFFVFTDDVQLHLVVLLDWCPNFRDIYLILVFESYQLL